MQHEHSDTNKSYEMKAETSANRNPTWQGLNNPCVIDCYKMCKEYQQQYLLKVGHISCRH